MYSQIQRNDQDINKILSRQGRYLTRMQSTLLRENDIHEGEGEGEGEQNANAVIEGYNGMLGPTAVNVKNDMEYKEMTALQDEFNRKSAAYARAHQTLMQKTKTYITSASRDEKKNINVHVSRKPNLDEIKQTSMGCYKMSNVLERQSDLGSNVSEDSCKLRASDLGYGVYAMQGGTGNCYVYNNVDDNKAISGGLATKPLTSYAFGRALSNTTHAKFLQNGRLGIFSPTGQVSYLPENEKCDPDNGGNITVTHATYGLNCNPKPITPLYKDEGCWNDNGGRMLSGGPQRYGYDADSCYNYAIMNNADTFALQDNGWCVTNKVGGNDNYKKLGQARGNCPAKGGPWVNHVYSVNKEPSGLDSSWKCIEDIGVPLRKNANHNVECMASDGRNCLWGDMNSCKNLIKTPPANLNMLQCGSHHKSIYGSSGYDSNRHWCYRGLHYTGS